MPRTRHRLPLHLVQRGQHILRNAPQHLPLVHLEAQKAVAQHHLLQFKTALVALFQVLPAEFQNTRELQWQFGAQKLDQRDPACQVELEIVGLPRPPQRCNLQLAQAILELRRVIQLRLRQRIVLDVGASVTRVAERIRLRHARQLLHVAMLLNQLCQVDACGLGKLRAQKNVGAQVIDTRNQPLQRELRNIASQLKLARHLA